MLRRPVDDRRHTFNIRFPHAVAAPVGVADFDSEQYALVTYIAFCHQLHLLALLALTEASVAVKQRPS